MTHAAVLRNLLFSENDSPTPDHTPSPDIAKNIEQFSVDYRKYIVKEMADELDKQDKEAEHIQRVKSNPAKA
ncbi:MAG TPA: hypothetical protein VF572_03275 [Candidatus Saccharimonadales bacterium]|jgi:hypothetical protein